MEPRSDRFETLYEVNRLTSAKVFDRLIRKLSVFEMMTTEQDYLTIHVKRQRTKKRTHDDIKAIFHIALIGHMIE